MSSFSCWMRFQHYSKLMFLVRTGSSSSTLLTVFAAAYRTSFQRSCPSDPLQIYHAIHPHPALSPVPDPVLPQTIIQQAQNESDYRHLLVQNALAILLPTDDLENDSLRALVGEIFAELILGNAIGSKGSEGWLWWEGIIKGVELVREQVSRATPGGLKSTQISTSPNGGLQRKQDKIGSSPTLRIVSSASQLFSALVQYLFLAFSVLRSFLLLLANSSSLSARVVYPSTSRMASGDSNHPHQVDSTNSLPPLIALSIFSAGSTLISLPARMPWIYGFLVWVQHVLLRGPFALGASNASLDR